jgi:hypothetical protein
MRFVHRQFRSAPVDMASDNDLALAVARYDEARLGCGLLPLERSPGGRTASRLLRTAAKLANRRNLRGDSDG